MANSGSKNPVKILRGGYEDFSAMYPFLRTQKILYMPQEYDSIQTFPCEVLPGIMYIGSSKQAHDKFIHKELKIRAHINLSHEKDMFFSESNTDTYLHVPIDDTDDADFTSYIDKIVSFIDTNRNELRTILVWSSNGISRSAAACILYLMSYYKWPMRDAWRHMRSCKFMIRPNRGLVKQLAKFEEKHLGKQITDIEDPNY
uniref:Serine/threonine/tyrosine-interacting-like protein 1 n=1 Tax=Phallusia mammillata TaxID=59560 RepID=A0A6F9DUY2_9ASCI|nr:serine/threonine/tyrosine-interacting-like protein 1 [Phallusia mammillata]